MRSEVVSAPSDANAESKARTYRRQRDIWIAAACLLLVLCLALTFILIYNTGFFAPYIAARGSEIYHVKGCSYLERTQPYNKLYFLTAADAAQRGLRPCSRCNP